MCFDSFEVNSTGIDFHYTALAASYCIRATLPSALAERIPSLPRSSREQLLTAIGIAFSPFLFKLSDFAFLDVRTAPLDEVSRAFFERFLVHGMGEFRYLQGLNPARPIRVRANLPPAPLRGAFIPTEDRLLLLNGGGKDTIVAAELLKAGEQCFSWLTVRPNPTRRQVIAVSGINESIEVGYTIDDNIELRRRYPWGHVPHTSLVLSFAVLIALLTGHRYVAAGNEFSSSFSNLRFHGMDVNHQYTKSYAFERDFSSFVHRAVSSSVDVFSLLRPFHDLQLARLFAAHRQYFRHFISCNRGIGEGKWCKQCPKCAFAALTLRPFLSRAALLEVFEEDLLLRPGIRRHVLDLVAGSVKPWECVGTQAESGLALRMVLDENPNLQFEGSPSRAELWNAVAKLEVEPMRRRYLERTQSEHAIPRAVLARLNAGLARSSTGLHVADPNTTSSADFS